MSSFKKHRPLLNRPNPILYAYQQEVLESCGGSEELRGMIITSSGDKVISTYGNNSFGNVIDNAREDFNRCKIKGVVLEVVGEADPNPAIKSWDRQRVHVVE